MSNTIVRKVLVHPDLEIHLVKDDRSGNEFYTGHSSTYKPYSATADTAFDCFFRFDIQLSEQKLISAFMQ